jgi:hypothetical protein
MFELLLVFAALLTLLVFGLVFAGIVYVFLKYATERFRLRLQPLQDELGGDLGDSFMEGVYLSLPVQSGEARISLKEGSQTCDRSHHGFWPSLRTKTGAVPVALSSGGRWYGDLLEIRVIAPVSFELTVGTERYLSPKLEKLGVIRDVKIGDPAFDEAYLVRCNEPERALAYLQDWRRRALVVQLMQEQHFSAFTAGRHGISASKRVGHGELLPEDVRTALDRLDELARSHEELH